MSRFARHSSSDSRCWESIRQGLESSSPSSASRSKLRDGYSSGRALERMVTCASSSSPRWFVRFVLFFRRELRLSLLAVCFRHRSTAVRSDSHRSSSRQQRTVLTERIQNPHSLLWSRFCQPNHSRHFPHPSRRPSHDRRHPSQPESGPPRPRPAREERERNSRRMGAGRLCVCLRSVGDGVG